MIREATVTDADAIATLCEGFYTLHPLSGLAPYDHDYVARTAATLAALHTACVYVAEVDGDIVGVIAGILVPLLFNDGKCVASEVVWYVHPDHRSTPIGPRLFREFEKWASHVAVAIQMVSHTNYPDIAALYIRKGYALYESGYIKEL